MIDEAENIAPVAFRPMLDGEEADIIALWQQCSLTRPWNDPLQDLEFARAHDHCEIIVGLSGDKIIASAMVGHDGHRGTMYYVSVVPGEQGSGIGRALIEAGEDWLRAKGVWKVNVLIRTTNSGVLSFYDSLGYENGNTTQLGRWIDPTRKPGP